MKTLFKHSALSQTRLAAFEERLVRYTDGLVEGFDATLSYGRPESALLLPGDRAYQAELDRAVSRLTPVDHVVLIGIGGSSLGALAVYHALRSETTPRFTVIDELDREALLRLETLLAECKNPSKLAVIVVSKSGTTTETMLNAVKAIAAGERRFGDAFHHRLVFISDKGTKFLDAGRRKGALCLTIPSAVGGRFSVLSAAGIVPLSLLGFDVRSLRRGARDALSRVPLARTQKAASILALHALEGYRAVNFFTFNRRFAHLGYWYRQLLAESIGKRMTVRGATFSHQLLPIVSTGADLHSTAQLFLSGYAGMYTHFVYYRDVRAYRALRSHWLLSHVPFLKGKSVGEVSEAIVKGVLRSYSKEHLPYRATELEGATAYEVGLLMNSLMAEVMCLAHLLSVDAFDQPNVESYKAATRKFLA
ncbi:MAG TPA: hypothetical protein VFS75_00270 [Candidatus Paceibacterota bacterium]|nr:hypothetical protein [Candidatus Paceibacterota bacterium]